MTDTRMNDRVISLNRGSVEPRHNFPEPKGHEKILAGCKKNRLEMQIVFTDGSSAIGQITQFDRWSITLKNKHDERSTYFKHAIKSFCAMN